MSYALAFALDAQIDWQTLDVAMQEVVLDELDRLAASASAASDAPFVHDFDHLAGSLKHTVFLYVFVSHHSRTVNVLSVGEFVEPARK